MPSLTDRWINNKQRWLITLAIAGVATLVANFLVLSIPWLGYTELRLHQRWLISTPLKPNSEIVLVEIHRDTPRKLRVQGRGLPLPRHYHATLIRALRSASAHALVLDLLFLDPSGAEEDAALRQALAGSSPLHVTLATEEEKAQADSSAPTGWRYWFRSPIVLPQPRPASVAVASAKAYDPDGLLDGAILLRPDEVTQRDIPHLALFAVLHRFRVNPSSARWDMGREQVVAGSLAWPVGADGELHARWTRRPEQFSRIEYADALTALATSEGRAFFREKIVIVGDVSGSDYHRTPLGRISGLEFVAHIVNTLLTPQMAQGTRWHIPLNALWAFLLALVVIPTVHTLRLPIILAGVLGTVVAAVLIPSLALRVGNLWIDTVGPCLTLLLAVGLTALREDMRINRFLPGYVRDERPATITENATVLFVDVKGSTPLAEKLGPVAYQKIMSDLVAHMFDAVLKHGADVDRTLGDGLMAVFRETSTTKHHNAEHHALRCVAAIRELLEVAAHADERLRREHNQCISLTIGFESGVVSGTIVRGAQYEEWKSYGPVVNLAARLQSACGQLDQRILCGPGAWACIRQQSPTTFLGAVPLKGIEEPMPVYSLDIDHQE